MLTSSMIRQDEPRNNLIIFGLVACSMYNGEYEAALADIRKIIESRKNESEPIRVVQAICNSGLSALEVFIDTKFQKYLLRQIKYIDEKALKTTGTPVDGDDSPAEDADMQETGKFEPTKVNPLFLMMYAHVMSCGKSYTSAIVYYLRAYDLRPDDPIICLSLALVYIHRAMQRQVDNRHFYIAQAIALLDSYKEYRKNKMEVQYNIGRVFHQLGLIDLAVKHYENVLEMVDIRRADAKTAMNADGEAASDSAPLDLSKEAAYNLSSIYFTRNVPDLARVVVNKYLRL